MMSANRSLSPLSSRAVHHRLGQVLAVVMVGALAACAHSQHADEHQHAHGHEQPMGQTASHAMAAGSVDVLQRMTVSATPAEYRHVIGDMQQLLRAMGQIQGALAQQDWATIAQVAGALRPENTMGSQDPASLSFHAKLPAGWSQYGAPMHQGFARMADEAQGQKRVDEMLRLMSKTTQQCASCHAQFQIKLAP